ncbi:MAG: C39 family peptidase [Oscillospiraceae bacterium]|jgi:hypothetical protein|nr:C39 family peptidase [Oscillospiraceae bacterium]
MAPRARPLCRRLCAAALCACLLVFPIAGEAAGAFGAALAQTGLPQGPTAETLRAWCALADAALGKTPWQIICQTDQEEDAWRVLTFALDTPAGLAPLATLRLDDQSGDVRLPPDAVLDALGDADFLRALAALHSLGIEADAAWYARRASAALGLNWLVAVYEAFAGAPVAAAGMTALPGAPEALRKAALLGLLPLDAREAAEVYDAPLTPGDWARWLLALAQAGEHRIYHAGALPVTGAQAGAALDIACRAAGLSPRKTASFPDGALTRADYAKGAMDLYLSLPGAKKPAWLPTLADTRTAAARQACALGLMEALALEPDDRVFGPDRPVTGQDLWALASAFSLRVPHNAGRDDALSVGQAATRLLPLLDAWQGRSPAAGETQVVDNGISAPWYVAQDKSGPYSAANCMPAVTAMALRWLGLDAHATAQSVRNLYPLDGAAWYSQQVEDVLNAYGASYAIKGPVTAQSLKRALDAGRILIALLNEGAGGHSVVIKGYRQEGEGLWFIVYDPASPVADAFGRPVGEDREIEAGALTWAMRAHWWFYFEVTGPAVRPLSGEV